MTTADTRAGGTDDNLAGDLRGPVTTLHEQDTVADTLRAITAGVIGTVPGADYAGLMVVHDGRIDTRAVTDNLVSRVDQAQYETGQGPCLEAANDRATVWLSDTRTDRRWPDFSAQAARLGIGSMLSLQLHVADDSIGALNLYARRPAAFTPESEHVGLLFAIHAALAIADARRREHLTRAINSRDLIGQAKGILMERHKITGDQAFAVLVHTSQAANIKLAEIATRLIETGELITPPTRSAHGHQP
ncbi:GAF and ANTAR domain-containing protein [Actinoplanes sp. Pm04-4]|uniref:GAF and ANTAR domain-containing protein n=1 Tax=Paractinoplanes pyxinae TaxID=2997416 RepID=A0ABT4B540_9ACTN|nr:GAF and ANTAR domain-containing protein [Actinoplanes pyxinae]MCY1141611.1 GAF and ANTAR domain-containing protein [Actinoplanes pyxinae]